MPLHHINKLLFQIEFKKESQDTALAKAKAMYEEKAYHILSEVFDEMNVSEEVWIDKIELDLGTISEQDFAVALKQQLQTQLQQALLQKPNTAKETGEFIAGTFSSALQYFLAQGHWPWPYQSYTATELTQLFIQSNNQAEQKIFWLKWLAQKPFAHAHRFAFLLSQANTSFNEWIEVMIQYHTYLPKAITDFKAALQANQKSNAAIQKLISRLLNTPSISTYELWQKWLESWSREMDERHNEMDTTNSKNTAINLATLLIWMENSSTDFPESELEASTLENDSIQINNAGLVLFHPFLQKAFQDLGFINAEKKFINITLQQKAVCWLQYLIHEKNTVNEHHLPLNKLLCGYPLQATLPVEIHWQESEKQIATDLKMALIEHWKILGQTSPTSLVHSFVERHGIIKKQNEHYTLQVENKGLDILLDQLPFTLSIIKQPWNDYLIFTEWTAGG